MTNQAALVLFASDNRSGIRHPLRLRVSSRALDAREQPVTIHNISSTGLLLETRFDPLELGASFVVDLPDTPAIECSVVWRSGSFFGCEFSRPISAAAVSAAQLRSPPGRPSARTDEDESNPSGWPPRLRPTLFPERSFLVAVGWAVLAWIVIGFTALLVF
jgi:hypothetical protein